MIIEPCVLRGSVQAPASKSIAHRAMICAYLATGEVNAPAGDAAYDNVITANCLSRLGGDVDCGLSASTLRFLIPVSLALYGGGTFTCGAGLLKRPIQPYIDALSAHGIKCEARNSGFSVHGELRNGVYTLPADISSQFATGLLLALPLAEGVSEIAFDTVPASKPYIDMTLNVMSKYGVSACWIDDTHITILGNQRYSPAEAPHEGDYSAAASFFCAGALGSDIWVTGLARNSIQGDSAILETLASMGCEISINANGVRAYAQQTHAAVIDVRNTPDIAPILALVGALSSGTTRIANAGCLRYKECDRFKAVVDVINALGGNALAYGDDIVISGVKRLKGGVRVDAHDDHRLVMLAAIAATRCELPIEIASPECVNKSYPAFFADYDMLGGKAHG